MHNLYIFMDAKPECTSTLHLHVYEISFLSILYTHLDILIYTYEDTMYKHIYHHIST